MSSPSLISGSSEEPSPSSSPENGVAARRLLTAIVRRAVLDYALYREVDPEEHPEQYALAQDARGWLLQDSDEERDEEGRYTFRYICMLLGIDARLLRAQVYALTREDLRRFNGDGGRPA